MRFLRETLCVFLRTQFVNQRYNYAKNKLRYSRIQNTLQENASRALVSFKSRVHKHRIFAVKARLEIPSCMNLVQIKSIPEEVLGMSTSAVYEVEEKCEENMEPEKLEEVQIVELERTPIIERAKTPLVEQEETHMVEQEEDHESVDLEEGEMLLEEELSVQDDGTEGGGVAEIKSEDVKKGEDNLTRQVIFLILCIDNVLTISFS